MEVVMHVDIKILERFYEIIQQIVSEFMNADKKVKAANDSNVEYGSLDKDADLPIDVAFKNAITAAAQATTTENGGGLSVRKIIFEGQEEPVLINQAGTIDLYCDPCDGSLNYEVRGNTIGLPFCLVVTMFPARDGLMICDALAAVVIDARCNDLYLAYKSPDGIISLVNDEVAAVDKSAITIDVAHVYYFEYYYAANRDVVIKLLEGKKGWFRNPGAAAYEMVSVGAGTVAMHLCISQKQHELGAAYLFNKGAGAECLNIKTGEDLGLTPFNFNTQVPVSFFATPQLRDEVMEKIKGLI